MNYISNSLFVDNQGNCWMVGQTNFPDYSLVLEFANLNRPINIENFSTGKFKSASLYNAVISPSNIIYAMYQVTNQSDYLFCYLLAIAPNTSTAAIRKFDYNFPGCQPSANLVLDSESNLWLSHPVLTNTYLFGPQLSAATTPISLSTSISFSAGNLFPSYYILSVPSNIPSSSSLTFIVQTQSSSNSIHRIIIKIRFHWIWSSSDSCNYVVSSHCFISH